MRTRKCLQTYGWQVAAVLSVLIVSHPGRAATVTGASIEWLCEFTPIVVQAQITVGEKTRIIDGLRGPEATCDRIECMKGKVDERFTVHFSEFNPPKVKTMEALLFLTPDDKDNLIVRDCINLENPPTKGISGIAFNKKGEVLKQSDVILKLAKDRSGIKNERRPTIQMEGLEQSLYLADHGESAQAMYSGSVKLFLVPPDQEFKKQFYERFETVRERDNEGFGTAKCLFALSFYRGEETVELLKSCLKNPSHFRAKLERNGKSEIVKAYVVRQAAYEALIALGQKPDKPEGYLDTFHLQIRANGRGWGFRDPTTKKTFSWEAVK